MSKEKSDGEYIPYVSYKQKGAMTVVARDDEIVTLYAAQNKKPTN